MLESARMQDVAVGWLPTFGLGHGHGHSPQRCGRFSLSRSCGLERKTLFFWRKGPENLPPTDRRDEQLPLPCLSTSIHYNEFI